MIHVNTLHLEQALIAFSNENAELKGLKSNVFSENQIWFILTRAILSSQSRYEIAETYATAINNKKLLPPNFSNSDSNTLKSKLSDILSNPIKFNRGEVRYRFPNSKSKQLATSICKFASSRQSLIEFMNSHACPIVLRSHLVENIDGLGFKTASMFLRDAGWSNELAIIDRHILDFMAIMGIVSHSDVDAYSAAKYESFELELKKYSNFLGISVGTLDWSIWIMMRVLKRGN